MIAYDYYIFVSMLRFNVLYIIFVYFVYGKKQTNKQTKKTNKQLDYRILFIILIHICILYGDSSCINLGNWNILQQYNWKNFAWFSQFSGWKRKPVRGDTLTVETEEFYPRCYKVNDTKTFKNPVV